MRPIEEKKFGKALSYRIILSKQGYSGAVISNGKASSPIHGLSLDDLRKQLVDEIAKSSPNYVGYKGAKDRFLRICPQGFGTPLYIKERCDKAEAKQLLDEQVPLAKGLTWAKSGDSILKVVQHTQLISPIEKARLATVLKGAEAPAFIRAAAQFASGNVQQGLADMKHILTPKHVATWPVVTYLPFLWNPASHMFLKPEVTKEYAERVGHEFAHEYSAELTTTAYDHLLELTKETEQEIADLHPKDRIDVQGFIWVVGRYEEPQEKAAT